MSKQICIIGGNGCGKTTYMKRQLADMKTIGAFIFDINNEYKGFGRTYWDKDLLLAESAVKRGKLLVIDEATAFFPNRGWNNDLQKIMALRRHNIHTVYFIYLSLLEIPDYVRRVTNYFVIFNSSDTIDLIKKKYSFITKLPNENFKHLIYKQF